MAINQRLPKSIESLVVVHIDGGDDGTNDDKFQKEKSKNARRLKEWRWLCPVLAIPILMFFYAGNGDVHEMKQRIYNGWSGEQVTKAGKTELYPFLVSSESDLSKPTLPAFPVISRLEDCKVAYKPSDSPRKTESEWRPMFWIPSYPGSGASNPTNQGNMVREIVEGLFSGEAGNVRSGHSNPVKDYHVSIKNKQKRCKGVSETVGCACNHPITAVGPDSQTKKFQPGAILAIRNPATAIPASFAYKNIAYHDAKKQAPENGWRKMRDEWGISSFHAWMDTVKYWRGTAKESSYYFTASYVAFEDLLTTDISKGVAMIKDVSDSISGRKVPNAKDASFFETSESEQDYECLWYRSAKKEWERQQTIIGDYIPPYTQAQKDEMVNVLNAYADEVEKDPFKGDQDAVLVSLLRRYANQIYAYVRVESVNPKREPIDV